MVNRNSTFQLFVLGQLLEHEQLQSLIILAEFRNSRAIERVSLTQPEIKELNGKILELRGFIESGDPPLETLALEKIGGDLFDLIIKSDVRRLFDRASGSSSEMLPLEIFVEDYNIASWPWEFLYDTTTNAFMCQEFNPISRGLFSLLAEDLQAARSDKVRILLVIGALSDESMRITPQEEVKWIQDVFDSRINAGKVKLKVMQGLNPQDLEQELQEHQYDIFHFFGHAGLDLGKREGYIKLERPQGEPFRFFASTLGQLLAKQGIRLVFLNGCETGRAVQNENPARSSVAAALLGRGVPAVISNQFSMPDSGSHFLSSVIYNGLANGKTLCDALRDGRRAMSYDSEYKFFDWGIPVLYCSNPNLVIFSGFQTQAEGDTVEESLDLVPDLVNQQVDNKFKDQSGHFPKFDGKKRFDTAMHNKVSVNLTQGIDSPSWKANLKVAIVDIDSKVGFLPNLLELANQAQNYYFFEVAYVPILSNVVRTNFGGEKTLPQLYLPLLEQALGNVTETLDVDLVCCLTKNLVAGKNYFNYFSHTLDSNPKISVVSTYEVREYAQQADLEFSKAVLGICLSILLCSEERWPLNYHEEIHGCLFDYCGNRDDIVVAMRHRKFDHQTCRNKIEDTKQLEAIDALMNLKIPKGFKHLSE